MLYSPFSNQICATVVNQLKRIGLLAILFCFTIATMSADKYRIVDMSSTSISIGGKKLKKGDVFSDDAAISWATNPQWITIKSINSGRISKLSRKQFESKSAVKTLKDFYLRSAKASTRGFADHSINFIESDTKNQFPERRIALVVGNSEYTSMPALKNPVNDASDITDKLLDLGFDVLLLYNGSSQEMSNALLEFTDIAVNYKAALVYYSGHGTQYTTKSYLVPIGTSLQSESEINNCISCDDIINKLDNTQCETRIAFFDACRTVPTSWNTNMSQEVSAPEVSPGTIIFFSTRSGRVAQDGDGRNSPFANALLRNIDKPIAFIELEDRLVKETFSNTQKYQFPIHSGTLLSNFKFNPKTTPTTNNDNIQNVSPQNQAIQQPQQEQHIVAPSGKEPYLKVHTKDLTVKATYFKRNGNNASMDVYITNNTNDLLEVKFLSASPWATMAFTKYENFEMSEGKIQIKKDGNSIGGYSFNCPSGVPVKITLTIPNLPSYINYFQTINLGLEYKKYNGTSKKEYVKMKDWVFADGSKTASGQSQQPPINQSQGLMPGVTSSTSDLAVSVGGIRRSGNDITVDLLLTNKLSSMLKVYVIGNNYGLATEAFADNGSTFSFINNTIHIYKDGDSIGGSGFNCPPGVPVKIVMKISGVSSAVKYFPLINLALNYQLENNFQLQTMVKLKDWGPDSSPVIQQNVTTQNESTSPKVKINTSDIAITAWHFQRRGNDVTSTISITNKTEDMLKVYVIGNSYGLATEAFADNGSTFSFINNTIHIYKDGNSIGGSGFNCPPGVPVKIVMKISGVSSAVKYFPLINLALNYQDISGSNNQALVNLINWPESK